MPNSAAMRPRYWHYWLSVILGAALIPALLHLHLPLSFDWKVLGIAYWILLAPQAIFVAVLLSLIGLPYSETLQPLWERYRRKPVLVVVLLLYFGILVWAVGGVKAAILTVDAVALLELNERNRDGFRKAAAATFPPAVYLFFGFLLILAYNCVIVSVRFNFATDPALAAIDQWILRGHSIPELTHWAVTVLPLGVFRFLEVVYFGMFPQIGAAFVILALSEGRRRALQLVGTILLSYYIALAIFYIWPAQGPWYYCPNHFSRFPASLQTYNVQKVLVERALALWHHVRIARISTDYFIGLPCMHIVQPLIVMWFLRRWKRMVIVLAAYDVVLVPAILLLEMHYLIDVIVGVLVAALAVSIGDGPLITRGKLRPAAETSA
jgi:hypothetical protein